MIFLKINKYIKGNTFAMFLKEDEDLQNEE